VHVDPSVEMAGRDRARRGTAAVEPPREHRPLSTFEPGIPFVERRSGERVDFAVQDADLRTLVRAIADLTGRRFLFGNRLPRLRATIESPGKVTLDEAYRAFLAVLETNGMTVLPHGRFFEIVTSGGVVARETPVEPVGSRSTTEDRVVTRVIRLEHVPADDVASLLAHFRSHDGDIVVYAPGNLLIVTDTGPNLERMAELTRMVDVGGPVDRVWLEPVHYASASELAARLDETFDVRASNARRGASPAGTTGAPGGLGGSDGRVEKVVADARSNSLLIVASEPAYLRVLEVIRRLDTPLRGEGGIHVIALRHVDAMDLARTLSEIVASTSPARRGNGRAWRGPAPTPAVFASTVKVTAERATNSLVITASLSDYQSLRAVVDRLDVARRQVFIDAAVLDLTVQGSSTLGVSFHGADTVPSGSYGNSLAFGGLNPLTTISLPDASQLQGLALGVRGPGIPGSANLLGTGLTVPAFGVVLDALVESGFASVLSTPNVLASDGEDAEIHVGQNIPLQTNSGLSSAVGSLGPLGTLGSLGAPGGAGASRTDVGTKVKVRPHLNESDEVRLDISEEISEAGVAQGGLGVIPITKRNATTKLVVRDQETVVIGGLVRTLANHTETKVPVLGDIPVLGALFRTSSTTSQKTNLLLILTPFLIREPSDLRRVFERKMEERQQYVDRYFVFGGASEYTPPHDYTRSAGLLEEIRRSYADVTARRAEEASARGLVPGPQPSPAP
jgi:general secretion pathway protein D